MTPADTNLKPRPFRDRLGLFIHPAEILLILVCRLALDGSSSPWSIALPIDIAFTVAFVALCPPRNEWVAIAFLIITYYLYAFCLPHLFDLIDLRRETVTGNLLSFGLQYPTDIHRFQFILILFKCVFLFVATRRCPRPSQTDWSRFQKEGRILPWYAAAICMAISGVGLVVSPWGVFGLMFGFWAFYLGIRVYLLLSPKSIVIQALILIVFAAGALAVTRSRLGIAIVLLYPVAAAIQRFGFHSHRVAILVLLTILIVSTYAVLRTPSTNSSSSLDRVTTSLKRFESEGEGGNIFLFGSHITGLAARGYPLPMLNDGLLDKAHRAIPFIPGKPEMLAIQYMRVYYPGIHAARGGWAYSGVAEMYCWGGYVGVALYAIAAALLLSFGIARSNDPPWRILTLLLTVIFIRSETALLLNYAVQIVALVYAAKLLEVGRPEPRLNNSEVASQTLGTP
jgi:hypothetical protein